MAPTTTQSDRTTRASTRSRTVKSQNSAQTDRTSAKSKSSTRVEEPRTNTASRSSKVKKSAKSRSKASAELKPKPDRHDEACEEADQPDASTSTPSNATALTINDDRVKSPIICHQYAASTAIAPQSSISLAPFIFTHGAGGTLSTPAMVYFCSGFSSTSSAPLLAFQGPTNLGARAKGFHACYAHVNKTSAHSAKKSLVFGGRSMGARAAVIAATEIAAEQAGVSVRLVLVSYPLQGPKDVRDQILLDMPEGFEVLFIVGDRDEMCPLGLLEEVRHKMKAASRVVVVKGADHGTNVKPASRTKEVGEETGRVAARWLAGEIGTKGEALHLNDEK